MSTFQAVLITNGRSTYVMFNYGDMAWTTGTASGSDCNGLGGVPAEVSATRNSQTHRIFSFITQVLVSYHVELLLLLLQLLLLLLLLLIVLLLLLLLALLLALSLFHCCCYIESLEYSSRFSTPYIYLHTTNYKLTNLDEGI